jgi:hypothetical protein
MTPVKVNIYISCAKEDTRQLQKLLRWLYPMRDEVNLWYKAPPPPPEPLPLPWQILLFWYNPPDPRGLYERVLQAQRERAHIYLFLTSYKSLSDAGIEEEITLAVNRRIEGDELNPLIFPVVLSPSRWQEESRLAQYKPLGTGKPLEPSKDEEAGYMAVVNQLAKVIKILRPLLNEEKYYQNRPLPTGTPAPARRKNALPYLGESDELLDFQAPNRLSPPEWLGWSLIALILVSVASSLRPAMPLTDTLRYLNIQNADDHGPEYRREFPLMPPADSVMRFPLPD